MKSSNLRYIILILVLLALLCGLLFLSSAYKIIDLGVGKNFCFTNSDCVVTWDCGLCPKWKTVNKFNLEQRQCPKVDNSAIRCSTPREIACSNFKCNFKEYK